MADHISPRGERESVSCATFHHSVPLTWDNFNVVRDVFEVLSVAVSALDRAPNVVKIVRVTTSNSVTKSQPAQLQDKPSERNGEPAADGVPARAFNGSSCSRLTLAPLMHMRLSEEEVRGVSLREYIRLVHRGGLQSPSTSQIRAVAHDTLVALAHLHDHACVIHGGVNVDNLFIDTTNHTVRLRGCPYMQEALGGVVAKRSKLLSHDIYRSRMEGLNEQHLFPWCAPEVFSTGVIDLLRNVMVTTSFVADVYALGTTLLYLAMPPRSATGAAEQDAALLRRLDSSVTYLQALGEEGGVPHAPLNDSEVEAIRESHGTDFLKFLVHCLFRHAEQRKGARELLHEAFILHKDSSSEGDPHRTALQSLSTTYREYLRDPTEEAEASDAAPVANARAWCLPFPVHTDVIPRELVKASQDAANIVDEDADLDMEFVYPEDAEAYGVAGDSTQGDDAAPGSYGSHLSGASDFKERSTDPFGGGALPANDDTCGVAPGGTDACAQACERALLRALESTRQAMERAYMAENAEHAPSTSTQARSEQNTGTASRSQQSPQPQQLTPATSFRKSPHHERSSSMSVKLSVKDGGLTIVSSPLRHKTPSLRESVPINGNGQSGGDSRTMPDDGDARQVVVLLDKMAREFRAMGSAAPSFAASFCDRLTAGIEDTPQNLVANVEAVRYLIPPLTIAESEEKDEAAGLANSRRPAHVKRGLDARQPLRTAEDWSQALTMPHSSTGGSAGALLFNKWLGEQKRKARGTF